MEKNRFRVRVYVNGVSPVVVAGGRDTLGVYVVTREASGSGYEAIPELRVTIEAEKLRRLDSGEDADLELTVPIKSDAFKGM